MSNNIQPITNSSINCVENNCSPKYCSMDNPFNECRPICEKVGSEEACNDSHGCYWNSEASQCQKIDAYYCTTTGAYRSHQNCRKDQNDVCYFSEGTCKVCNSQMTNGTFSKLISMDGTQCFDASLGCAPYYKQGNHAACRKYCEFTQEANNNTYTCDTCSDVNAQSAINGKCVNYTECEDVQDGYHGAYQQPKSGYFRFLGITDVLRKSCTLNQYNATPARRILALQNNQFVQLDHFRNITKETDTYTTLMANCSENFIPLYYQYLATGQSGASLTAAMDTAVVSPNRLISRVCSCPPGYMLNTTDKTCTKCPDGKVSARYDATECVDKCQAYRQNNNTCVSSCEKYQGFATRKQTKEGYCFNCTQGSIGTDGGKCVPCPASYYRDSNSETCQRCSNNKTTADPGAFSAEQCNVNCTSKISTDGKCVSECTDGSYSNTDSVYCQACPAGKYVPANVTGTSVSDCQDCPVGTYKTEFGSTCVPCPGKNTTSGVGATHEGNCTVQCPNVVGIDGTCKDACEGNQLTINGRCLDCQVGQVASIDGSKCLDFCPAGQAPAPNKTCQKCQAGYYQPTPNTSVPNPDLHSQYCVKCPSGKVSSLDRSYCHYCPSYHYIKHGICVGCPEGQYAKSDFSGCVSQCPDYQAPNKYGTCTACKPGQQFTTERKCVNCPRRTFSPDGHSCQECPDGYAAKAGSAACTKCEGDTPFVNNIGTSCTATCNNGQGGNTTTGNCEDCPAGFASNDDNSACVPCTGNTYTDKPAQKVCKTCPDNTIPIADENGNNIGCQSGCNPGQYLDNDVCKQCPAGQISANTTCYPCEGMTVPDDTQSSCVACPAGQYPNQDHTQCIACDGLIQENLDGTYSCVQQCDNEHILVNSTICTPCPAGQFSIDKKKCLTCLDNKYYSQAIKRCVHCPPGSYSKRGDVTCTTCVKYLAESGDHCVSACQEGYFVNDNRQCEKCPLGSITLIQNAKYCVSCSAMTFADPDGRECVPCPAGAYSAAGATECIQCTDYVNSTGDGCTPHCAKDETIDDVNKRCYPPEPVVPQNNNDSNNSNDDGGQTNKNSSSVSNTTLLAILIPIIFILVIALVVVLVFMLIKRKKGENMLKNQKLPIKVGQSETGINQI